MMGGYGYGGGYAMGPGMMDGYGRGPGAIYGYDGGYGAGMMYGYGQNGQRSHGRHHTYRGKRLCWHRTGQSRNSGYYGACS
jgi:hypothetical protein